MTPSAIKRAIPLAGTRVVVVGLAREGAAVAQFLAHHGAQVTITDAKPASALSRWLEQVQALPVTLCLGAHPDKLLNPARTDFLVVSPGVPLTIPFLQRARANGLPLTTESRLFCQLCPAPIVGISGSSGKTTTATLVGNILAASGYATHVGGNIGRPLINALPAIAPADRVVLELSSFQLEYFHGRLNRQAAIAPALRPLFQSRSPSLGALLNITPNHLDRHKTMAAYTQAKRSLVDYITPEQTAVMGRDNAITRQIGRELAADVRWFSRNGPVQTGAYVADGQIMLARQGQLTPVCRVEAIKLRGEHNQYNVLAAAAIAEAAGADAPAIAQVVTSFTGVAHRLEVVARQQGVTYINDSIATSPERLIAGLNSFTEPIILLAGGKDKDLPWQEAARHILKQVKHLMLFGQAEELVFHTIEGQRQPADALSVYRCGALAQAVLQARALARPGDVVLLSPGGTSYDAYPDFAARGEHFKRLVLSSEQPGVIR